MFKFTHGWSSPTLHMSPLLLLILLQLTLLLGLFSWFLAHYIIPSTSSFLVFFLVMLITFLFSYSFLFLLTQEAVQVRI